MEKDTIRSAPTPVMHDPPWWTERDGTAWDRVKGAFRREWEGRKGDTSRSPAPEASAAERTPDGAREITGNYKASWDWLTETSARRERADATWQRAEEEGRFGYTAHVRRPGEGWNSDIEAWLCAEWEALNTGRAWSQAQQGIRRGWDFVGR